jgi:hypothetical protein
LSEGEVIVTGYGWEEGSIFLRVRSVEDRTLAQWPLEEHICFRVTEERRCVGHAAAEGFVGCPHGREPSTGTQCEACASVDLYRPCLICDGSRCPKGPKVLRERCDAPHVLYLACFGEEQLKVGTAALHRRTARVVEQGPLAAARIARASGPTIKQMEHHLSKAGFTETMRRAKKMALLHSSMTEEQARALVEEAAAGVPDLLPDIFHSWLHPAEFVVQPPMAAASRSFTFQELPVQTETVIEGDVVGAVGHVLFLEDETGCYGLDLGALKTRVIQRDPDGPRARPTVQLGLF